MFKKREHWAITTTFVNWIWKIGKITEQQLKGFFIYRSRDLISTFFKSKIVHLWQFFAKSIYGQIIEHFLLKFDQVLVKATENHRIKMCQVLCNLQEGNAQNR